jgi:hypothetical protein
MYVPITIAPPNPTPLNPPNPNLPNKTNQKQPNKTKQLAEGRFAILALPKRSAPDDSSVLDDPVVRASSLAMGAVLQVGGWG